MAYKFAGVPGDTAEGVGGGKQILCRQTPQFSAVDAPMVASRQKAGNSARNGQEAQIAGSLLWRVGSTPACPRLSSQHSLLRWF